MTSTNVATTAAIGTANRIANPPKQDGDRRDGDEHEQGREPDGMPEHARDHDVVLEQPDDEHRHAGEDRRVPRDGRADGHRDRSRGERPDHGDDLDDPGEDADEQPVGQPDRPERKRQCRRDERDQQQLSADERAQLEVDQVPGVADDLALPARQRATARADRSVALEDPVRGGREGEEDADERLEHLEGHVDRGAQDRGRVQPLEPVLERDEHLVADACRVLRGALEVLRRRGDAVRAERLLHLVERARDDQPEEESDQPDEDGVVEQHSCGARDPPAGERLDARPHRRGDDEREEEQAEDRLELPEGERRQDDRQSDERRDEGSPGGLLHLQPVLALGGPPQTPQRVEEPVAGRRRALAHAREDRRARVPRGAAARGRARAAAAACTRARGGRGRLLLLPWAPALVLGALLLAFAAFAAVRNVWRWERTRLVITTEKLFVVHGTVRRRAAAVRLARVESLEFEQGLLGRLLGYGTLVAGPLEVSHVAKPRQVFRLLERLCG